MAPRVRAEGNLGCDSEVCELRFSHTLYKQDSVEETMKKQVKIIAGLVVLCAVCLLAGKGLQLADKAAEEDLKPSAAADDATDIETAEELLTKEQKAELGSFQASGAVIVLDAGHGGFDPGKVGVNDALEKDINLAIAKLLKQYLELAGFEVSMTRESDDGLYAADDSNKKAADMKARIRRIEEKSPLLAVSIHQNSFTQESSFGAQVFYYKTSKAGAELAQVLQETLRTHIEDGNYREAKANDSYYMLKKSPCPMVIVECGFLSNREEAAKLVTEEYQKQLAWAICMGIVNYYNAQGR